MTIDTIEETMDKLKAINKAFRDRVKMEEFDAQGRHRSEWCYAPYDGRIDTPPKDGQSEDEINPTDCTE